LKNTLDDLALFGGQPEFSQKLHVGRPNIGSRERLFERLNDMLDRRWLTNHGPYVQELEAGIAALTGARHCIALTNATVALEIAIRALGFEGEVIVPSFTFIATAHALQWQNVRPVFADIDPHTHNLDPQRVEEQITECTTGILGVHVWGRPCPVDALQEIANRRGLRLLYDAAHALGCSYHGRPVGNFGDAEVFSFHATKFFNSFEGGAVTTNNDELARKIRLMSNFGFAGVDQVVMLGTNAKMTEPAAAMGLTSLESLDEFIAANYANYCQYRRELDGVPGLSLARYDENERNNYQYIIAEVDAEQAGLSRDELVRLLWPENVLVRRYFYPGCHQMEPYRSRDPQAGLHLPETERLTGRAVSLPNGTAVGQEEIERLSALIHFCLAHSAEIRDRMQTD